MKAKIDVKDRQEAAAMRAALVQPDIRAFVVVAGVLEQLPSTRAQERVLTYVCDAISDKEESR